MESPEKMVPGLHPSSPLPGKGEPLEGSAQEAPVKESERMGWGGLAARMAQWTTRGLVCAIIVVASVGFGRQVLQWWSETPPESGKTDWLADPMPGWGDEGRVHRFRFGNAPWEFRRQVIVGDRQAALARLQKECAQVAAASEPTIGLVGLQERQFLERLKDQKPMEQWPGWAVYGFQEGIPLVVGVREKGVSRNPPTIEASSSHPKGEKPTSRLSEIHPKDVVSSEKIPILSKAEKTVLEEVPAGAEGVSKSVAPIKPEVAPAERGVVSWGFAFPSGEGRWTVYILVAVSGAGSSAEGGEFPPPPPGGILLYSLGVHSGGGVCLVEGPPQPEIWKNFYQTYFQTHRGRQVGTWQQEGPRWKGRFLWSAPSEKGLSQGSSAQEKQARCPQEKMVQVYFGPNPTGKWSGFIWIWPEGASVSVWP